MPDATRGQVGETGPKDTGRGFGPLEDTMPWVPEDDPVLRELRAWRDELASSGPPGTPRSESAETRVADAGRVDTGRADTGRSAAARPSPTEPRPVSPSVVERIGWSWRPERADDGATRGAQARPDRLDGAVESERPAPVPTAPRARHAAWSVLPEVESEPFESDEERELAAASTVAFPSIDPADLPPLPDAPPAIVATNLHKRFGDFTAVHDVSFSVPAGQIVALLGPNGAGKTTTVNMLCTLLPPDGGTAEVAGCDVASDAAGVRRSIMLTGQFAALDESLTGRENLILFGRLLGLRKKDAAARADELLAEFSLTAAAGKRVGQYSGGMRRRIDIACGLVTKPEVVFLDEPTTGLDPRSRQDVWNLVEKLRDSGVTILLTTQYLEEADILSDNIVVIDAGRVIAEGTSDELKAATGAAYCEVTPTHPAYLPRLRAKLRDLIGAVAADDFDSDAQTVSVPAPNGPETLAEVMRRTEAAKIPLADIALRRPSLDEVFLALTGDGKADDAQ